MDIYIKYNIYYICKFWKKNLLESLYFPNKKNLNNEKYKTMLHNKIEDDCLTYSLILSVKVEVTAEYNS